MAISTQETVGTGHGTSQIVSSALPYSQQSSIPVEMSDLGASQRTGGDADVEGASRAGLPGDVAIPSSSSADPSSAAAATTSKTAENLEEGDKRTALNNAAVIDGKEESKSPLSSSSPGPVLANTTTTTTSEPELPSTPAMANPDSVAIESSTDTTPTPIASESEPVLVITLLLTSGARHPYKIDEKYLTKRNVDMPGMTEAGRKDPFSISVYTLKELILREWREEWETQPSSPSSIRLIYFGRLLDDKTPLKECRFNVDAANVVHMTVRPQDIVDEEDASKSKALSRDRGDRENTAGCRCVIQ